MAHTGAQVASARQGRTVRRFEGSDGRVWDVVVGRESWGALVALFVPVAGDVPIRQTMLSAASHEDAAAELEALTGDALEALLDRSTIKES